MLGVCARTVTRCMNEYNLEGIQFSVLTDQELDRIVTEVHRQFPQSGYRQILAMLKSQGIYVREHRPIILGGRWLCMVELTVTPD